MTPLPSIQTAPRYPGPRSGNGFTIIETLLAATIGAFLVVVCLGVMSAMDRTDAAMARRQAQIDALARLHLVMDRTFGNLVMQNSGSGGAPGTTRATATPQDTTTKDTTINGVKQTPPRPRMVLEEDHGAKSASFLTDPNTATMTAPMLAGAHKVSGPQRLEVVLSKAPAPAGWGRDTTLEVMAAVQATDLVRDGMASVRGVFELKPDRRTPSGPASATAAPDQGGMTLWWRPLPASSTGAKDDPFLLDAAEDPTAVPLVSGLVQCQWLAFKTITDSNGKPVSRGQLPELSATQFSDLPAYMEMNVRTAGGLTANWMFEIGWSNGAETTDEAAQDELDGGGVAGGGGGGGRAGAGGPGRGGPGGGPGGPGAGRGGGPGAGPGNGQRGNRNGTNGGGRRGGGFGGGGNGRGGGRPGDPPTFDGRRPGGTGP